VHYLRFTPEDSAKAVASFERAVELDPNYGRAYAGLAAVYFDATLMGALLKGLGVTWPEARLRSLQYLQKAGKDPITHYVKSRMYLIKRQHQEAISELERGLALDPNDPACHQNMGFVLTMAGRPKEAIEYLNRGMRLDPHNPSRYLVFLGQAHFSMGELEEAAALFEKAMRLNPENAPSWAGWLAVSYALLGREQEARVSFENVKKAWAPGVPFNLRYYMYFLPYKDRVIADRFAEGMLKAGIPGKLNDYLPAFKENRLTGAEIKNLFLGSALTGIGLDAQQRWWNFKKNGEFTYRGPKPISSDTGKVRIEGDVMYVQYQKLFGGVEYCMTVFRNPRGTSAGIDEYFSCHDFGVLTYSLVKQE
jgi:tetratricopeptide (TPR) repeat protein